MNRWPIDFFFFFFQANKFNPPRQRQRKKATETRTWDRKRTRELLQNMKAKNPKALLPISTILAILDMEGKNVRIEMDENCPN
jgi:hypothetical protein